jgi:predicted ATPase
MQYIFADFVLDEQSGQLERAGEKLALRPKVVELLLHLLRNRARIISRQDLLERLWPDVCVSESSLSTLLCETRLALDDSGVKQAIIETLPRRGYRFVAPVELRTSFQSNESPCPGAAPLRHCSRDEPMVGRAHELALLDAAICAARESAPRHLMICGELGMGKSRLMDELAAMARARGLRVLRGAFGRPGSGSPLWTWGAIARSALEEAPATDCNEPIGQADRLLTDLAGLGAVQGVAGTSPPTPSIGLEGAQAAFRIANSIGLLLQRAAKRDPVAVLLEDLQWADAPSLAVLKHLLRSSLGTPILMVCCLRERTGVPIAAADEALMTLSDVPRLRRLTLAPFTSAEVAELAMQSGLASPSLCLLRFLEDQSAGNPLLLSEALAALLEQLEQGHEIKAPSEHDEDARPPSPRPSAVVRARIGEMIDALPGGCAAVLQQAALMGRSFRQSLLEEVSDLERTRVAELLDAAITTGMIRHTRSTHRSGGELRFTHGMVRTVVAESLDGPTRAHLHRRMAEAIEAWGEIARVEHIAELARHYRLAAAVGCDTKAVEYSVRAARSAGRSGRHDDAARQLQYALDIMERFRGGDEAQRLRLLGSLARAHLRAGDPAAARAAARLAARLARTHHERSPGALARHSCAAP